MGIIPPIIGRFARIFTSKLYITFSPFATPFLHWFAKVGQKPGLPDVGLLFGNYDEKDLNLPEIPLAFCAK